jgi:pimeloyl-ACP methyl ester carboxylesterase
MRGGTLSIEPFTVDVDDGVLVDLRERLRRARFPEQMPGAGWDYGTERGYLRSMVSYWAEAYDWRSREARMNELDHFRTEIDGAGVHFIHVRSPVEDALPLVLTHGWPGSFIEFLDVIGPLADPVAHGGDAADAFHVVVPSLPGYAFSGPTRDRGWHPGRVARAWATLMAGLGYDQYVAQGGDWGSFVTIQVGRADPDHCAAIHVNFLPPIQTTEDVTDEEQRCLATMDAYNGEDSGYFKEQSTKPQTIGYALDDSPVGLAAWILEKFRGWTERSEGFESRFTKEQLLDNLMVYWVTATAHSSARMYYEFERGLRDGSLDLFTPIEVPIGYARYPNEIMYTSKRWAEGQYPTLNHFVDLSYGGHFAAFEVPELFVPDVRECFRHVR